MPISYYLALSAVLFGLGRDRLRFQAQHHHHFHVHRADAQRGEPCVRRLRRALGQLQGQVFVFFVIVVAAAEAAVGLAIVIVIARNRQSLNVERINLLKL